MNIKLSGNGVGENKVVFEKLLAKWDELFTRKSLFDEIEFAEGDKDGTITLTNDETELSFYQTEASKANRNDIALSLSGLGAVMSYVFDMKFLHGEDGKVRKKFEEPKRDAVILTDIVYEVYAEKRISFVFSKYTDSKEVILHIEFTDDESDSVLSAMVTASADDDSLPSLEDVLGTLGKDEMHKHLAVFKEQIVSRAGELNKEMQKKLEKELNEQLQPAFEALDNL